MKKTIQTKRNKPSGSRYRMLHAKTGRKRRLNAATAATVEPHVELESDVPNVGIGRALLVILVLHVVAITVIYIHSTFFGNDETTAGGSNAEPVAAVAAAESDVSEISEAAHSELAAPATSFAHDGSRYIVVTGDTYQRISQLRNVDETALRALNGNRLLRAGVVLDLPAELSSRPVEIAAPVAKVEPEVMPSLSSPVTVVDEHVPSTTAMPERHDEADISGAPKAVVVKPAVQKPVALADVKDSGERYTIKTGDTLWRISNKFKVSRDDLLKLNGIKDANKLYAGRTIKIPVK